MRILISADPMIPVPPVLYGGIERIVSGLIDGLAALGHTVGLIAHPDSRQEGCTRYAWPHTDGKSYPTIPHVRALHRAVAEFRPQLVHSFSRLGWLVTLGIHRRLPLIMSYQREISARNVRWSTGLLGRQLRFTACSSNLLKPVANLGSWTPIHNFVDPSRFAFGANVGKEAPLLFLSRLDRIKGPHLAIAAARRSGHRLILAGNRADSGPEREYFDAHVAPEIDGNQIQWVGPVDDSAKIELLQGARALLVPIQWEEPFGIVFAEALACGVPVISSPRGALPEIVEHGEHGFLVEGSDALVSAIRDIGRIDRAACRRRFEAKFSSQAIVSKYEELYINHLRAYGA